MYFISNLFLFINLCTTFTCFASAVPSLQSDDRLKGLSDAELAIIGLSPPNDKIQNSESESYLNSPAIALNLKPQESLTNSFITYDDSEEEQQTSRSEKPFTITFPINRHSRNKQSHSVQSIVIPLPSDLNDKTGIIVIEDHDDGGGNLDRRTLRAQFFSPTRIKPIRPQPLREEKMRNETEKSINRITVSNKLLQNNRNLKKDPIVETKAEPSTTSSVIFDDDIITVTSTFSPESVFRPKSSINKRKNLTALTKLNNPIIDTMSISLKARQRVNKKLKNLKNVTKPTPKPTTTTTSTTTTTTTTTEPPTTTELFDDIDDFEDIELEDTETTTFSAPETTTRSAIFRELSLNDRPNVRRRWNHSNTINHTVITTTTTTRIPTTTERLTTTTEEPTTTTQRITTTQRPTTERTTTKRRSVPRRRTQQRLTTSTTTTTTASPTTSPPFRRREWTTTSAPLTTTESDFELISLDNSTKNNFDGNSLRLVNPKNKTISSGDEREDLIPKPRPPGAPHIPQNFGAGFLPSGKAFNLPHNVPGSAGVDYPTYDRVPVTPFDCKEQIYPGFYADMETGCQVYHSCNGNLRASKHTFLCPNGTIFSQEYLICDWWYNVNCADSPLYYPLNKEAFSSPLKHNSTQTPKQKNKSNIKKTKPKTTTTEFVIRTITTTDLP